MAIEIIKPGVNIYRGTCGNCGCVFTFERSDIQKKPNGLRKVYCPHCRHGIMHLGVGASPCDAK